MEWVKFFVLTQAVVVLVIVIIIFFQMTMEGISKSNETSMGTLEEGYLPKGSTNDFDFFSKKTAILIVLTVIEIILLMKMFE
jgi:preprotein translocase subunit SecG